MNQSPGFLKPGFLFADARPTGDTLLSRTEMNIALDSASLASSWNFRPGAATQILYCDAAGNTSLTTGGREIRRWSDPLAALNWMADSIRVSPAQARWVGYLSYDLGRCFEAIPFRAADDLRLPLFAFSYHDVTAPRPAPGVPKAQASSNVRSNFTRSQYKVAVERVIEYIRAGDVFQVNLAQRFTAQVNGSAVDIYGRLREHSPAEYGALLDYTDSALVSNSPELFLRITPDRRVITRPIKGTRPALAGMEQALRQSPKDQAELNMIVDLERNDLGRVCEIGSVKVIEARTIESHPTVYHGVATIAGRLRADVSFVDLLRATFPGGSVTGAPKIRAMQIIDELEPVRRGAYCGAIGYLAADGTMEFNVAIRTMVLKGGLAHIWVGGGVVADSDPDQEYEETLVKAQAMFAALGVRL